jgi:hypothetical protein
MPSFQRILPAILIIPLIVLSCNKDDCTGKITIPFSHLESFGGAGCGIDINEFTRGLNFVVVDQATMESLLACDTLPRIDFDKYILLIGSFESDVDLSFKNQAVIRDCNTQMVIYRISFESEHTDTSMLVDYHAVIPKIPDGYVIDFEIDVWQVN